MPGRQHQFALFNIDDAFVFDGGRHQHHFTVVAGVDEALIQYFGIVGQVFEFEAVGEKVLVTQVKRAGNKAGGVDDGVLAEYDTIGVDQIHLAVGLQLAEYGGRIAAGDAVKHGAAGGLLHKTGDFVGGDTEGLPVDDSTRRVGNRQGVTAGLKAGCAVDHVGATRVGKHIRARHRNRRRHDTPTRFLYILFQHIKPCA